MCSSFSYIYSYVCMCLCSTLSVAPFTIGRAGHPNTTLCCILLFATHPSQKRPRHPLDMFTMLAQMYFLLLLLKPLTETKMASKCDIVVFKRSGNLVCLLAGLVKVYFLIKNRPLVLANK